MDPQSSTTDQNVERLLRHAYRPEQPDPEFVAGLQLRLRAVAQDQAYRQSKEARMSRFRTRMSAFMAVAASIAFIGLMVYAQRQVPSKPGVIKMMPAPHAKIQGAKSSPIHGLVAQPAPEATPLVRLAVGGKVTTSPGELDRVELPDGSRVALNADTEIRLESDRKLILERGEIFVEVAPAKEQFFVKTPKREVVALGTKFAVRHEGDKTGVIVTQGKVQVSGVEALLHAGQQLLPDATKPADAPRATAALDWARDLLAGSPLVPGSKFAGGALVAFDPTGQEANISMRRFHLDVHVEDGFARTTIDQTYFNHAYSQLEGTFYFPLPADASISRLAMYVNGQLMEGGMAERDHARNTFEQIRYTRRDPALLEWMDGSTFKMRVFPLEPRQEKRIILSYSQRLPNLHGKASYRFPLGHNLPVLELWSVNIRVKGGAMLPWLCPTHVLDAKKNGNDLVLTAEAKNVQPSRDLQLDVTDTGAAAAGVHFAAAVHEGQRYVGLRYRPELKPGQASAKRKHYFVLFEASADRDPLLARTQIEVLRTLLENLEHDNTFSILAAGTKARWVQAEPVAATPKNIEKAIEKLESAHLVGALDLGQALEVLEPALAETKDSCLFHLGSGVPVLGEKRDDALIKKIPAETMYAGVAVGKRFNRTLMKLAAERSGGHYTQIHPDEPVGWRAFDFLAALFTPRLQDVKVTDNAGRTWLVHETSISAGEELFAVAAHPANEPAPTRVTVSGRVLGDKFERKFSIDAASDGGYLPRTWGKLEIDRLVALGAEQQKGAITELSKRLYVMSPFTSLLVLENDAMYSQFKIDRGRKDHWARYEAPAQMPVVRDAVGPPAPKSTGEQVLRSIIVRNAAKPLMLGAIPPGSRSVWDLLAMRASGWGAQQFGDGDIFGDRLSEGAPRLPLDGKEIKDKIDESSSSSRSPKSRSTTIRELDADVRAKIRAPMVQPSGGYRPGFVQPGSFGGGLGGLGGGGLGGLGGGGLGGLSGGGLGGFGGISGFSGIQGRYYMPQFSGFGGQPGWAVPGGFPGQAMPGLTGGPLGPGIPGPGGVGMPGKPGISDLQLPYRPFGDIPGLEGQAPAYHGTVMYRFYGQRPAQSRPQELAELEKLLLLRKEIASEDLGPLQKQAQSTTYQLPMLQMPTEVGRDLLAFAPGMDTMPADVLAVLAKEAGLEQAPGTIDDAARRLIDRARAIGWRKIVLPARLEDSPRGLAGRILIDGTGRCVIERTLPHGLQERIVCDGFMLWHLYGEIGVGARRSFSRFHHDDLRGFAPWLLPSADDLARGGDLKAIDARTVAVVPRGIEGAHRELWLVFGDDGRLAERRVVELPAKKVVHTTKFTANEYGEPAEMPALRPDLAKMVVLSLPYRTSAHANDWAKRFGQNWFCKQHARDMQNAAMLAEMKDGHKHSSVAVISAKPGHSHGALTILRAANMLADAGSAASSNEPLGRYWKWWTNAAARSQPKVGPADSFLQRIAELAYLQSSNQVGQVASVAALRSFVENNRNEFGVATVMLFMQRAGTAGQWQTLAELWWSFKNEPAFGHAARYERIRCLLNANFRSAATVALEELCRFAVEKDVPLYIDAAWATLSRGDGSQWFKPLVDAATAWAKKSPERVLALALQCRALSQPIAADVLFAQARPHLEDSPPAVRVAAVQYLLQSGNAREAQRHLQPLLKDERFAKSPAIWRLEADMARQLRQTRRFVEALDRALDLEFAFLPEAIDVQQLRNDYGALLEGYRQLIDAMRQTEIDLPADMQAKIVRAADRWRSLDPDMTTACFHAARLMRDLDSSDLAWEYITSPLAARPNDADPLRKLSAELVRTGEDKLAEKAFAAAFTVESTDAQLLWDRAQVLQRLGRNDEAQAVLKQLAEGTWQPRFEGLKQQARQSLRP